jgi:hypothetical protein
VALRFRHAVTETTAGRRFSRFGARSLVSFNLRWCECSVATDYSWRNEIKPFSEERKFFSKCFRKRSAGNKFVTFSASFAVDEHR